MRALILSDDKGNLLPENIENVSIAKVYNKKINNKLLRSIRKVHFSSLIPYKKIWLGPWYNKLKDFDSIILFATGNSNHIIDYIRHKDKNIEINVWYWGPTELCISPLKLRNKSNVYLWSFDYRNCEKYSLKFNTQFYCYENMNRIKAAPIENSFNVYWIGTDKSRLNELIKIKNYFKMNSIPFYFHVVQSGNHYHNEITYDDYRKPISYSESLFYITKCKTILDLNDSDQTGLSLHPLEALFFKKKLITNNSNIKKEKLYNKNNVFILGEDDMSKLKEFIEAPFNEENMDELTNYYSIQSWVNRFEE